MVKEFLSKKGTRIYILFLFCLALVNLVISVANFKNQNDIRSEAFSRNSPIINNQRRRLPIWTDRMISPKRKTHSTPNVLAKVGSEKISFNCGNSCDSQNKNFQMTVVFPIDQSGNIDRSQAPYPMISFLHGAFAKGEYYLWVGETLAAKGYIVLLPNKNELTSVNYEEGIQALRGSIEYMLKRNQMEGDKFQNIIDSQKLGIGGHSMGANTTIVTSSEINNLNLKACVVLSPCDMESLIGSVSEVLLPKIDFESDLLNNKVDLNQLGNQIKNAAQNINIPFMIQAGSLDGICKAEGAWKIYNYLPGKKAYVEIGGGNHVQFMDTGNQLANLIAEKLDNKPAITRIQQLATSEKYMTAFFDFTLKGDPNGLGILQNGQEEAPHVLSRYDFK